METERGVRVNDFVFVGQKVEDVDLTASGRPELPVIVGDFRRRLQKSGRVPGEKFDTDFVIDDLDASGVLPVRLPEEELRLPLVLTDDRTPRTLSSVRGVAVHDGGNVQNMIVNVAIVGACDAIRQKMHMTVFSSSDPFANLRGEWGDRIEQKRAAGEYVVEQLPDVPDRRSLHLPWHDGDDGGTFLLSTPPRRVNEALDRLLRERPDLREAFRYARCYVAAEPLFGELRHYEAEPPYAYVLNPSSAFRGLSATRAYGTNVVLPMNHKEAADVLALLEQRGRNRELHTIERANFPPPLTEEGQVDVEALATLDASLLQLSTYNSAFALPKRVAFTYPITMGKRGGVIVGTNGNQHPPIACFTTTPSPEGSKYLTDVFGDPGKMIKGEHDVGPGDSAASVVALLNAIDPAEFVAPHLAAHEEKNHKLRDIACTVFAGLFSRIAGAFLVRTKESHWANIAPRTFATLLEGIAGEAVAVAREATPKFNGPVLAKRSPWDMHVLLWKLGNPCTAPRAA